MDLTEADVVKQTLPLKIIISKHCLLQENMADTWQI